MKTPPFRMPKTVPIDPVKRGCPKCGGKLKPNKTGMLRCEGCGRRFRGR